MAKFQPDGHILGQEFAYRVVAIEPFKANSIFDLIAVLSAFKIVYLCHIP